MIQNNPSEESETYISFETFLIMQKYATGTIQNDLIYIASLTRNKAQGEYITQQDVDKFIRKYNNANARTFLKRYIEWQKRNCLNEKELRDYWRDIDIPKIRGKQETHRIKFLTREEVELLASECPDPRMGVLILAMFQTGCRISEALKWSTDNLHFDKGAKRPSIRGVGKGGKPYEVSIDPEVAEALLTVAETTEDGEPIFWWLTRHSAHARLHRYGISILGKPVHPHMLRHSTGTELRRAGLPLELIKDYLRHVKLDTTLVYAEVVDKEKQVLAPVRDALFK